MSIAEAIMEQVKSLPEQQQLELLAQIKKMRTEIPAKTKPGKKYRTPGSCKGLFTVPDDFDDPLPPEILKEFHIE